MRPARRAARVRDRRQSAVRRSGRHRRRARLAGAHRPDRARDQGVPAVRSRRGPDRRAGAATPHRGAAARRGRCGRGVAGRDAVSVAGARRVRSRSRRQEPAPVRRAAVRGAPCGASLVPRRRPGLSRPVAPAGLRATARAARCRSAIRFRASWTFRRVPHARSSPGGTPARPHTRTWSAVCCSRAHAG